MVVILMRHAPLLKSTNPDVPLVHFILKGRADYAVKFAARVRQQPLFLNPRGVQLLAQVHYE